MENQQPSTSSGSKVIFWVVLVVILVVIIGIGLYYYWLQKEKNKPGTSQSVQTTSSDDQMRKFVALGSSITEADNLSLDQVGGNPYYSFSVGTKINSFYQALQKKGESLEPVNLASSGATMSEIANSQAQNISSYAPKYITVDPGADIAMGTSVDKYKQDLETLVTKIKNSGAKILIANYPNFTKMRTADFPSCKENKLNIKVENLTDSNIAAFNTIIKDVASANNLIEIDLYPLLGVTDVSEYDCLHPNIAGQQKIADAFTKAVK